ncbi:uncharacterized protein CG13380-like [Scaptodrosophila lebanonensis]|uniref:Uncharacterized protein CG13380-like n=1 Tax=Drosophila lebanonensis TaxID=7225 RepID=A0A6J2TCT0_DROLE|nr:uncharacterized protein CG13380-like [Scaptodrosophila lebanonensis]
MEARVVGKQRSDYSITIHKIVVTSDETKDQLRKDQHQCVCERKRQNFCCLCCRNTFIGRISQRCPVHPEVAYLMDARNCGFCGADVKYLQLKQ